jgi:hypothetical protein
MKRKTPQEKKALSYAKDCRNTYGENDKAARKNIPLHKARVNRAYRSKVNKVLNTARGALNLEESELLDGKVKSIGKDGWKKYADTPLGKFVEEQMEKRQSRTGKGKTARQTVRELVGKLKFEAQQNEENLWIVEIDGLEQFTARAETPERAIEKARYITQAAIANALGFQVGILIDGEYIKPILEINREI